MYVSIVSYKKSASLPKTFKISYAVSVNSVEDEEEEEDDIFYYQTKHKIFNKYACSSFYFQSHFLLVDFDFFDFAFVFVALPAGFLLAAFTFGRCLATAEPALLPPILNIFVPHTEQVPETACLPFFIVTCFSFFISLLALHFTQYACVVTNIR
jgi:hypothetical protein